MSGARSACLQAAGAGQRSGQIAEHIKTFWDSHMFKMILAHLGAGCTGLEPNSRKTVEILRVCQ
jgi:formate dehydrogenase subunit delta